MSEKVLRHFRLTNRTVELMDQLVSNPPSQLADGPHGAVKDRTDLIERLVWQASREIPASRPSKSSEGNVKASKAAAKKRSHS